MMRLMATGEQARVSDCDSWFRSLRLDMRSEVMTEMPTPTIDRVQSPRWSVLGAGRLTTRSRHWLGQEGKRARVQGQQASGLHELPPYFS